MIIWYSEVILYRFKDLVCPFASNSSKSNKKSFERTNHFKRRRMTQNIDINVSENMYAKYRAELWNLFASSKFE